MKALIISSIDYNDTYYDDGSGYSDAFTIIDKVYLVPDDFDSAADRKAFYLASPFRVTKASHLYANDTEKAEIAYQSSLAARFQSIPFIQ